MVTLCKTCAVYLINIRMQRWLPNQQNRWLKTVGAKQRLDSFSVKTKTNSLFHGSKKLEFSQPAGLLGPSPNHTSEAEVPLGESNLSFSADVSQLGCSERACSALEQKVYFYIIFYLCVISVRLYIFVWFIYLSFYFLCDCIFKHHCTK